MLHDVSPQMHVVEIVDLRGDDPVAKGVAFVFRVEPSGPPPLTDVGLQQPRR